MSLVKIILVEDHPLMRSGIRSLISDSGKYEIVGEAGSMAEAIPLITQTACDLLLVDVSLPDGVGLELIPKLRPQTKAIVLTMHKEDPYLAKAMSLGAWGYVVKDLAPERLIDTMDSVVAGEKIYSVRPVFSSESASITGPEYLQSKIKIGTEADLSERESSVLRLLYQGYSLTEISEMLHVSVKTIFTYRVRILKKLGAKNNVELISKIARGEISLAPNP